MFEAAFGGGLENPLPVDDPLADFGEGAFARVLARGRGIAGFQILDVELRKAAGEPLEVVYGILACVNAPEAVELEIHRLGICAADQLVGVFSARLRDLAGAEAARLELASQQSGLSGVKSHRRLYRVPLRAVHFIRRGGRILGRGRLLILL